MMQAQNKMTPAEMVPIMQARYVADHPRPRWRPIPRPLELMQLLEKVALDEVKPVMSLSHALAKVNSEPEKSKDEQRIGYHVISGILGDLSMHEIDVTDVKKVHEAVRLGTVVFPPGVTPQMVVAVAMGLVTAGPSTVEPQVPKSPIGKRASFVERASFVGSVINDVRRASLTAQVPTSPLAIAVARPKAAAAMPTPIAAKTPARSARVQK